MSFVPPPVFPELGASGISGPPPPRFVPPPHLGLLPPPPVNPFLVSSSSNASPRTGIAPPPIHLHPPPFNPYATAPGLLPPPPPPPQPMPMPYMNVNMGQFPPSHALPPPPFNANPAYAPIQQHAHVPMPMQMQIPGILPPQIPYSNMGGGGIGMNNNSINSNNNMSSSMQPMRTMVPTIKAPPAAVLTIPSAPTSIPQPPPPIRVPILITPILTNKLAVNVYIGKIPDVVDNVFLQKILDCCGKVVKWSRPFDYSSNSLKTFGIALFDNGTGALRCLNVLSKISILGHRLNVKVGDKDSETLKSLMDLESKAASVKTSAIIPEEEKEKKEIECMDSSDKNDNTNSDNKMDINDESNNTDTDNVSNNLSVGEKLDLAVKESIDSLLIEHVSKNELVESMRASKDSSSAGGADSSLTGGDDKEVLSEIVQFRMRQQERDAVIKQQRDKKVKEKIAEFQRKLQNDKNGVEETSSSSSFQYNPNNALPLENNINNYSGINIRISDISNSNNYYNNNYNNSGGSSDEHNKSMSLNDSTNNDSIPSNILGQTRLRDEEEEEEDVLDSELEEARKRRKEVAMRLMFGMNENEDALPNAQESKKMQQPEVFKTKIEIGSFKKQAGKANLDFEESSEATSKQRAIIQIDYTVDDNDNYTYNDQDDNTLDEELGIKRNTSYAGGNNYSNNNSSSGGNGGSNSNSNNVQAVAAQARSKALEIASKLASSNSTATASIPSDISAEERMKIRQKELVGKVPTEKSALFAFAIDWNFVGRSQLLDEVVRPWVVKKFIEYLEEDVPDLVNFVLKKLESRCSPADLVVDLQQILDEDAEQFVVKLWRFLIFSVLKALDNKMP